MNAGSITRRAGQGTANARGWGWGWVWGGGGVYICRSSLCVQSELSVFARPCGTERRRSSMAGSPPLRLLSAGDEAAVFADADVLNRQPASCINNPNGETEARQTVTCVKSSQR